MVQDEWCVIQLRPVEDTKTKRERWILGDTFLRAYDSVHDLQNRRIGLIGDALTSSGRKKDNVLIREEEGSPAAGVIISIVVFCILTAGFFIGKNYWDKYQLKLSRDRALAYKADDALDEKPIHNS